MTVRETKEHYGKCGVDYVDIEVYQFKDKVHHIHTDRIRYVEDYSESDEVLDSELMDEDTYNQTILANAGETADFAEWYDDKDAKVLIMVIK